MGFAKLTTACALLCNSKAYLRCSFSTKPLALAIGDSYRKVSDCEFWKLYQLEFLTKSHWIPKSRRYVASMELFQKCRPCRLLPRVSPKDSALRIAHRDKLVLIRMKEPLVNNAGLCASRHFNGIVFVDAICIL